MTRLETCMLLAALGIGCSSANLEEPSAGSGAELSAEPPTTTTSETTKPIPIGRCAIATFEGPSYYVANFATYDEAKKWLSTLDAKTSSIEVGPCARDIACPMVYAPLCASVSGSEQATYGNSCELLAATRLAAGALPGGSAKGAFLHDGECKAPTPSSDPCAGKECGEACPSMFGSPVATYCDAKGTCTIGKPVCEVTYDCDRSSVKCDSLEPICPDGMTISVIGACYGPCVPVTSCKCAPGSPTSCPDGWVCHANTNRCGPYVN
jgi:hypothetical protein